MDDNTSIRLTPAQSEFMDELRSDPSARSSFLADAMAWLRKHSPTGTADRSRVPGAVRHALKKRGIE